MSSGSSNVWHLNNFIVAPYRITNLSGHLDYSKICQVHQVHLQLSDVYLPGYRREKIF